MGIVVMDNRDPLLIGQLRRLQVFRRSQRMILRQSQQHLVIKHLGILQILFARRRRHVHQREVQAALAQALNLRGGRLAIQRNMHVRARRSQGAQRGRKHARVHGVFDITDTQPAIFAAPQSFT